MKQPTFTDFLIIKDLLNAKVAKYASSICDLSHENYAVLNDYCISDLQVQAITNCFQKAQNIFESLKTSSLISDIQNFSLCALLNRSDLSEIEEPQIHIDDDSKLILDQILSQDVSLQDIIENRSDLDNLSLTGKKRAAPETGKGKEPAAKRRLQEAGDEDALATLFLEKQVLQKKVNELEEKNRQFESSLQKLTDQLTHAQSLTSRVQEKVHSLETVNKTLHETNTRLKQQSLSSSDNTLFRSQPASKLSGRKGSGRPSGQNATRVPDDLICLDPKIRQSSSMTQLPSMSVNKPPSIDDDCYKPASPANKKSKI